MESLNHSFKSGRYIRVNKTFGTVKKWSLVALDRWSLCTVQILLKFGWADFGVVVIGRWSLCRGGR